MVAVGQDQRVTRAIPVTPAGVVDAVVARADEMDGLRFVAIDGAAATDPHGLGGAVVAAIAPRRQALHVRADRFWRPAGQRFEYGKEDVDAYLDLWLDVEALRREVFDAALSGRRVLEGLRDPASDRSLRLNPVEVGDDAIVVVSGSTILGRSLEFEVAVHLRMSPSALARRTPAAEAWTLDALARYATDVDPESVADLVVRCDDPAHPALVVD